MAKSIDFVVLIDTPLDIAMARRFLRLADTNPLADIEQTTKEQLREHVEGLLGFLTGELQGYLDASRAVYIAVQEQVAADCDLILDGRLPPDELAEQLVSAVREASG